MPQSSGIFICYRTREQCSEPRLSLARRCRKITRQITPYTKGIRINYKLADIGIKSLSIFGRRFSEKKHFSNDTQSKTSAKFKRLFSFVLTAAAGLFTFLAGGFFLLRATFDSRAFQVERGHYLSVADEAMVYIIGGAVVTSFVLLFLLRYRVKMAALLNWLVGSFNANSIFGSKDSSEDPGSSDKQLPRSKEKNKSKRTKLGQTSKKQYEDPCFSTSLTTPIEEIIEESLLEDTNTEVTPLSGSKKKSKSIKQRTNRREEARSSVEDDFGFSLVKNKLTESAKANRKKVSKDDLNEEVKEDDLGFTFLPVREKGKRNKGKATPENKTGTSESEFKKAAEDPSKPSIIDHYQKKKDKQAVIETVPVVTRKFSDSFEKIQISADDNRIEEKSQLESLSKAEPKESKKVSPTLSYASVVTNSTIEGESVGAERNGISLENLDLSSIQYFNESESNCESIEVIPGIQGYLAARDSSLPPFEAIRPHINQLPSADSGFEFTTVDAAQFNPEESNDFLSRSSSIVVIGYDTQVEVDETVAYPEIEAEDATTTEQNSKTESDINCDLAEATPLTEESAGLQRKGSLVNNTVNSSNPESLAEFIELEKKFSDFDKIDCISEDVFVTADSQASQLKDAESSLNRSETEISFTCPFMHSSLSEESYNENHSDKFVVLENPSIATESAISSQFSLAPDNFSDNLATDIQQGVTELIRQAEKTENLENSFHSSEIKENIPFELIEHSQPGLVDTESQVQITPNLENSEVLPDDKEDSLPELIQEVQSSADTRSSIEEQIEREILSACVETKKPEKPINSKSPSKNKKFISSEFIEEEKFVKKTSYVTTDSTEESSQLPATSIDEDKKLHSEKVSTEESSQLPATSIDEDKKLHSEKVSTEESSQLPATPIDENKKLNSETGSTDESPQLLATSIDENKKLNSETMQQVRVLTLNDLEHQESTLYRMEKGWIIEFRVGPSLFGRKVFLYCNYPVEKAGKLSEFNRNKYQLLEWVWDEGCENADDTAAFIQIRAGLAGSFHYFFTYSKGENFERHGSGYFLVDPILKYGANEDLPLDCIQCQTVLTKGLGSFSSWENKLRVAKESGYNMIHFTPIQELGESNSAYCLSEQLQLNPTFKKDDGKMPTFEDVEGFVSKLSKEWKVTSICDIVLNHTANESKWIQEHPEVTYNCSNCPHMRPAYLLDAALHQFSMDVKKGLYEDRGVPAEVNCEEHLDAIRYHFRLSVLEPLNIPELYMCDVNKNVVEFLILARTVPPVAQNKREETDQLKLAQDPDYRRLSASVDMDLALKLYNVYWNDTFDEESRLKRCAEELKKNLESLNKTVVEEVNGYLNVALDNVIAGLKYFRVQQDGPRFKEITKSTPLVYRYFTDFGTPKSLKEHEEIMYSDKGRFLMAHNGWVMESDPLKNFAAEDSKVYIKRELNSWGDSVKLRFGDKPEDNPFLWDHMRKYVEQTARIFHGVRLDNCHSTPIPVAEYLLDCARRVRPDLYVVAELFTSSDLTDNIFVNRLGITSLIREAMAAWDSHEEGRLVYRYGGCPVGSFHQPSVRPLVPSIAHALFLDQTHDNPSPVEKRSVFDLLPSTALVNMACCASGSNRGYDELVPHHIHVVDETREYTEWAEEDDLAVGSPRYVTEKRGLIGVKRAINELHFTLGKEGFKQVYVDQMDPDIVAVTRHCPDTHQSYILVSFTAFSHPNADAGLHQRGIKPLRFEGVLEEIVLEASVSHVNQKSGGLQFSKWENFAKDSKYINGLSEYQVSMKQHISIAESDVFEKVESGTHNVTQLNFKNFKPGSIVVVRVSLPETMKNAVKSMRNLINKFSLKKQSDLSAIIDKMALADLNRAIYRCDQEERDEGFGFDTYNIPNFGSMVYAGLQGFMSLLSNIRPNNDLGHPMCGNLRDGNWMIDFIWKRLKLDQGTEELGKWIEENTKWFTDIPRYLVPCYFDMLVTGIYILLMERCFNSMTNFVKNGSTFARGLSLGSVQFGAHIKSADLPILSPNLAPPKPLCRKSENGETVQACVTLSAGLPHFSVGYMRNWGRDTFIALRGLFILTGRYQESREHILGYAACLRHGLIPNLLDGGRNPRFNCRDAVWWWLYCIKEYVIDAPNGISILSDKVSRIFPKDDSSAQPPGAVDQPLHDVMQEALNVHFQGLAFRERNAGRQIDEHMTDQGFNNQIGVHPETGFVFGGNQWNCGTWMDKMGSSDKAGNRGKPASPRDGSAVELIGLSKSVVSWLAKLGAEKKYPYSGVERTHKDGRTTSWSFKEWSDKIQVNFEKYFWINSEPTEGEIRPDLINKRGIYKDCYGAGQDWTDFQLRCNFPIAMVAAPELFSPAHAWEALAQAEKSLLGPLGMKTLDPDDWAYRGDYDNSNDSADPTVANGFNYHQGPEWVWPIGFFLRAKLIFAAQNGALKETLASAKLVLSKHFVELQTSAWKGLPELTNTNGSYCAHSSRTQAWSMSCILEVLHDLQKIESSINLLGN